jgi:hypothetical protein
MIPIWEQSFALIAAVICFNPLETLPIRKIKLFPRFDQDASDDRSRRITHQGAARNLVQPGKAGNQ